jgi:hypothetical protein
VALDLNTDKGTPLDAQKYTWRELVPKPLSKLDDDAFTRVRVLMNGIEHEKLLFNAAAIRFSSELRPELESNNDLAQRFRSALSAEETHLEQVRTWLRQLIQGEAGLMSSMVS